MNVTCDTMKVLIQKSKNQATKYLIISIILLGFFTYKFLTDTTQYLKGNSFYWIAIALFGFTTHLPTRVYSKKMRKLISHGQTCILLNVKTLI